MSLTPDEFQRYSRHILLPEIGVAGQERLKAARILLVGLGGLGSPAALYLAAAGVGTLGLVDFDTVDHSNLHRQILYGQSDVGARKVAAAAARIRDVNPNVAVEPHDVALGVDNALDLVSRYDVIVDGTDNFATRYLVNDACVLSQKPNVYGSVFRFEGQASVFSAPGGPCYRCLHPEPPPAGLIQNCAEGGVLGVLPGVIGTLQAAEAIKIVTGIGEPLIGRLLLYDALRMRFRQIALPKDPDCPVCGVAPIIRKLVLYEAHCVPGMEGQRAQDEGQRAEGKGQRAEITPEVLEDWRRSQTPHVLIDVREPSEHAVSAIEGSMLIPLQEIERRVGELPSDRPVVVHCKSGGRSARATALLRRQGIDARNLVGGIDAWWTRARG